MQGIHLFELASRQAEWLSVRQAAVSGHVATANAPGFKARDVAPIRTDESPACACLASRTNQLRSLYAVNLA
jgi:hypothetical protein